MTVAVAVAVIDHRRQRGRFTRTGTADENHQAALGHRDILQYRRQVQFFKAGDFRVDDTQHHAGAAALNEGVDTKTRHARQRDGKVTFLVFLELGNLLVVHDRTRQHLGVVGRQVLLGDR